MSKMLVLRLYSLFIWLIPGIFLCLKYLELQAEKSQGLGPSRPISDLQWLAERRLDDPSLWAFFASGLAAVLVIHGLTRLGPDPRLWAVESDVRRFRRWRLIAAVVIALGYLLVTLAKHEALFWMFGSEAKHRNWQFITIQLAEGLVNLAGIWMITLFFAVALEGVEEVQRRKPSQNGASAASYFASAAALAVTVYVFADLSYRFLTAVYGSRPYFFYPWPLWFGIASILPIAIPFGIVYVRSIVGLHKSYDAHVQTLSLAQMGIWFGMALMGMAGIRPPRGVIDSDTLSGKVLAPICFCIPGSGLALWTVYTQRPGSGSEQPAEGDV